MSRGLGNTQRRILDELDKRPQFYLDELASSHSEQVSLSRAAYKLADAGLIGLTRYICGSGQGGRKVFIHRPGTTADRRAYHDQLYRERHPDYVPAETYAEIVARHNARVSVEREAIMPTSQHLVIDAVCVAGVTE